MTNKNKYKQKGGLEPLEITNGNDNKQLTITNVSPPIDKYVPIGRIPYDIQIFSFICILGIISRIIFAQINTDFATSTIWGYGFSLMALFGLVISSFAISNKNQYNQNIMGYFKNIISDSLPIILTLVIVAIIIIQNISFYNQINSGKVPDEYYSFSGISAFLILVQISFVIYFLFDKLKENNSKDSNKKDLFSTLASELNSIILVFSVANFVFIGLLQVILKYFSTDG